MDNTTQTAAPEFENQTNVDEQLKDSNVSQLIKLAILLENTLKLMKL